MPVKQLDARATNADQILLKIPNHPMINPPVFRSKTKQDLTTGVFMMSCERFRFNLTNWNI